MSPRKVGWKTRFLNFYLKNQTHFGNLTNAILIVLAIPSIIDGLVYLFGEIPLVHGAFIAARSAISRSPLLSKIFDPILQQISALYSPSNALHLAAFFSCGFFVLLVGFFWLFYSYKNVSGKSRVKDALLLAYQRPEPLFRLWAQNNTATDKTLFDLLFCQPYSNNSRMVDFDHIKTLIETNIEKTIDISSQILSAFTGTECKAEFKALRPNETIRGHQDYYLFGQNRWCDERSREEREVEGTRIYLDANLIYKKVLYDEEKQFVEDDLASWPDYDSLDERWRSDRNAVLVRAVRKLDPIETVPPFTGVLTIDNMEGGLTHATCIHYVKEFCHRLAIMHYRLSMVSEFQLQMSKGAPHGS